MSTYKDPRDDRWRYRFSFRGRRYKGSSPKESNKQKVAEALERQHLDRLVAQRYAGVMPTVSSFIATFLDHQRAHVKPLTVELQERHLKLHVEPTLGKRKLDQVGAADFAQLVIEWRKAGTAVTTINTRLGTLLRMFGVAVEWEMLAAPPKANFLKVPKETPRFLSEDEASLLLSTARDWERRSHALEWFSMILVGLRTGMRIGELRGLQWGDVDLEKGMIHVRRTDPGRPDVDANSPKGGRGRFIPLTPDALSCLRELAAAEKIRLGKNFEPSAWVWPGATVWRTERDRKRTRAQVTCGTSLRSIAERAGVKDVGWHTLRHTFASWLVMRGVPLRVVQELLGHASIRMTERYAHLAPGFVNHAVVASLDVPLAKRPALPSAALR